MNLLEGILDNDRDIEKTLNNRIPETKTKIVTWLCDNCYTSTKHNFRRSEPMDFEIDDDLLISVSKKRGVNGLITYNSNTLVSILRCMRTISKKEMHRSY